MDSVENLRHHGVTTIHVGTNIVAHPDMVFSGYQSDDELETPLFEDPPKRPIRVRFRSQVRITSGLHQHRHKSYSEQDYASSLTPSSSISSSPSSSIYAPLHTPSEDEISKPGWGTLGQRVSILAQRNADQRFKLQQQREHLGALLSQHGVPGDIHGIVANERTPLRGSSLSSPCLHGEMIGHEIFDSESEILSKELDLVFGPWPNRLLNYQVYFFSQ